MRTSRRLRIEATGEVITPGQYTVLAQLRSGPQTLRELAELEHVQAPSMNRIVNALTEQGFVVPAAHPKDGRRCSTGSTEPARKCSPRPASQRTAWLAQRVATLSEEDRRPQPGSSPDAAIERQMSAMFRALENPNYRIWAGGALVSNIGTWMQRVAQDWLVLTVLTNHSGAAVGITTGLQFLPMLLLGPYGGVLADRYRKRIILLWTQTAMGLTGLRSGCWWSPAPPSFGTRTWPPCFWVSPAPSTHLPANLLSRNSWTRTTSPTLWHSTRPPSTPPDSPALPSQAC